MFKSYYVVWKQEYGNLEETICDGFKSYYVVWKQYRMRCNELGKKMFKSYYVVWKQNKGNTTVSAHVGLNRTM